MKQIGYRHGKPTPGDEKLRKLRTHNLASRTKQSTRNRGVKVSLAPIKGAAK